MMKKGFGWVRIILYLSIYIFFASIKLEQLNQVSICFIHSHFGLICPTCGITTAFYQIMHFNFLQAYTLHPIFTVAVFPVATFLFLQDTFTILMRTFQHGNSRSVIEFIINGFTL
jgi:hypothetical protein